MSCDLYQKFEMGELSEREFAEHERTCPVCRQAVQKDRELLQAARMLEQPVEAPLLWAKIENSLQRELRRNHLQSAKLKTFFAAHRSAMLRLAAVLVIAIGIGSYFLVNRTQLPERGVLAASTLAKIEVKEREYENAISELEKLVDPKLAQMDMDLMLLYRDRLETIDSQIVRCKEALLLNPGNAHIRRYLLAALQDKRETLREVNDWQPQALLN